jgi:hypothetical protein
MTSPLPLPWHRPASAPLKSVTEPSPFVVDFNAPLTELCRAITTLEKNIAALTNLARPFFAVLDQKRIDGSITWLDGPNDAALISMLKRRKQDAKADRQIQMLESFRLAPVPADFEPMDDLMTVFQVKKTYTPNPKRLAKKLLRPEASVTKLIDAVTGRVNNYYREGH